jgi:hypothetical protein
MRFLKWGIAACLLAAVPMLAFAGLARAERFTSFVDKGETVNSSIYSTGKEIDISGTVNGDIYCAGQTVNIDAKVNGDVICAGVDVTIAGEVDGDIRVAGQNVSVSAKTTRGATVAASVFSLDAGAKIGRDISIVAGNANVKGAVGRDLVASGGPLVVNSKIGHNVKYDGQSLELRGDAVIGNNVQYKTEAAAKIAKSASVKGEIKYNKPTSKTWAQRFNLGAYMYSVMLILVLTFVAALILPKTMQGLSKNLSKKWSMYLLVGFVASVAIPVLTLILAMSFVALPVAIFILLAWAMTAIASVPVVAYFVGDLIWRRRADSAILVAVLGGAILGVACALPFVGAWVLMLTYMIGSGAIFVAVKNQIPKPNYSTKK